MLKLPETLHLGGIIARVKSANLAIERARAIMSACVAGDEINALGPVIEDEVNI